MTHDYDTDANSQTNTPTPSPKQPVDTIRDGSLKATIWQNETETGPFYATNFSRTFKDKDGNYRDSHSFVGSDLLKLSELARTAYTRTNEFRREDREQAHDMDDPQREVRRAEFHEKRSAQASPKQSKNQDLQG